MTCFNENYYINNSKSFANYFYDWAAISVYSRMALSEGQEIMFPAPSRGHTLCFYTFAGQTVTVIFSADPAGSLKISSKGYYCAVAIDSAVLVSHHSILLVYQDLFDLYDCRNLS